MARARPEGAILTHSSALAANPVVCQRTPSPPQPRSPPITQASQDFTAYDLDDVDTAFGAVRKLKFTQSTPLPGPAAAALAAWACADGVRVTPFAAGHTLGGAVWRIDVGGEEVVYAVDTNHRKEM
jgi:Cft2 family RNA processing exonuclease